MLGLESLALFGVFIFLIFFNEFRKRNRLHAAAKKLPGHEGLSIIDSLKLAAKLTRKDYIPVMESFMINDLPFTKIWLVNYFAILTKDADFINKVFNIPQTYDKPNVFYQVFFMDHALTPMGGDSHRRHRRILNKAFSKSMLDKLPKVFDEKSKKILLKMQTEVDECEFELSDYVGALSLESFGKVNLNYEIEYFRSEIFDAISRFMFSSVDSLPFALLGLNKNVLKYVNPELRYIFERFNKFLNDIVATNRIEGNCQENTIADLLLDPKNEFSDVEIQQEFILITVASFATSTKTLSAILMMLGMHKDVQHKLFEEITEIYSHDDAPVISNEFIDKFKYLDAVVKETMRLFPAIPIIGREVNEDVEIDGYLIPKSTMILISLYSMHRDEKYWGSDAHLFKPERFFEELENPRAFAPFADGKRICIGYKYALMSMKIFLINFLKMYKIDCAQKFEDIQTEMTLTINFVGGFKASIQKR